MIETLLTALAFGTVWFWIIAVVASIIIIACIEHEHYPTPSIVAILLGVIYWKQIVAAPWQVIALVVGIFAVTGACWSAFQWFRRVNTKSRYYEEKYGTVLSELTMSNLKDETSASRHKALITGWIAFWPWDMFWTLTGDFFNMIYDAMANVYQRISDRAVGKFSVKQPDKKEVITNDEPSVRKNRSGNW